MNIILLDLLSIAEIFPTFSTNDRLVPSGVYVVINTLLLFRSKVSDDTVLKLDFNLLVTADATKWSNTLKQLIK